VRIAFIGGGNMASALVGGLLNNGFAAEQIAVVEVDPGARERLSAAFGVHVTDDLARGVSESTLIVLAVKPQNAREVSQQLRPLLAGQLLVSIAAGIRTADLSRWLGGYARVVRVMPNTPALVRAGVSALYAMPEVGADDRARADAVLSAVGATLWVAREDLMDAVTAVSGSGPAYVFYFMEAMQQAAAELGLTAEQARQLTQQTFLGAALLAQQGSAPPDVLRARVTSKGGTTERALKSLDEDAVKARIVRAIQHAAERSRQLGEEFGREPG
jgi:pyrroline-5-carboxylate reductase